MLQPPKPYAELSTSELAQWVGRLIRYPYPQRMAINMALAEATRRLSECPEESDDSRVLHDLSERLIRWLRTDDDRRMGGWDDHGDGPRGGGGVCMCSIERLEERTTRRQ